MAMVEDKKMMGMIPFDRGKRAVLALLEVRGWLGRPCNGER